MEMSYFVVAQFNSNVHKLITCTVSYCLSNEIVDSFRLPQNSDSQRYSDGTPATSYSPGFDLGLTSSNSWNFSSRFNIWVYSLFKKPKIGWLTDEPPNAYWLVEP